MTFKKISIITTYMLLSSIVNCYAQSRTGNIKLHSSQLIYDVTHSTDFNRQIEEFNKKKEDTGLNNWLYHIPIDSFYCDTLPTELFRFSTPYFIHTTNNLNIRNKPIKSHRRISSEMLVQFNFDSTDIKKQQLIAKRIHWNHETGATNILLSSQVKQLFKKLGAHDAYTYITFKYDDGFFDFSVPVFNKDFTVAIIEISYHKGIMNSCGGTFLCKKINNKWLIIDIAGSVWIS